MNDANLVSVLTNSLSHDVLQELEKVLSEVCDHLGSNSLRRISLRDQIRIYLKRLSLRQKQDWLARIAELCEERSRIQAIKETRELFGLSLRESKDLVDRLFPDEG